MGRGGYSGGSSMVNIFRGGFASYDPAEPRYTVEPRLPLVKTSPGLSEQRPDNLPKSIAYFVSSIVISHQRGYGLPKCPANLRRSLETSIENAGGTLAWAQCRPEYKTLYEKHRKKSLNKAGVRYEAEFQKAWKAGTRLPELPPVIAETYSREIGERGGVIEWTLLRLGLVGRDPLPSSSFEPLPSLITPISIGTYLINVGLRNGNMELSAKDLEALSAHLLKGGVSITWTTNSKTS